jgi:hypothetical protein
MLLRMGAGGWEFVSGLQPYKSQSDKMDFRCRGTYTEVFSTVDGSTLGEVHQTPHEHWQVCVMIDDVEIFFSRDWQTIVYDLREYFKDNRLADFVAALPPKRRQGASN